LYEEVLNSQQRQKSLSQKVISAEDAERRSQESERQAQERDRDLQAKKRELAEAEEQLRVAKRKAGDEIAAWTDSEMARLKHRFNEQYESEVTMMKKELAEKLESEFEQIQEYFLEFAKDKKSLAGHDIQDFLKSKLTEIKNDV